MRDFEHPRLGKLKYDREDGWDGWIELPRFVKCRTGDDERYDRELSRRIAEQGDSADEEDSGSEYDAEEIEEYRHRKQGKLRLRIEEVGRDGLSPAQERTLDYLLDHEEELLNAVLASQSRLMQEYDDNRRARSPAELQEMMSFSYVEFGGDAVDGFVIVSLSGGCDWDIEHGFDVELLHDRVLDGEQDAPTGFPATVPESINLDEFLPPEGRTRPVEFQIYGRWSGVYQIDFDGAVVARQACPLCPGQYWDPEGVEAVRSPASDHLKLATNPYAMILPGAIVACGCLAPVLLVLGLLIWGGLFWGALAVSLFELTGKWLHPLLREKANRGDYLRPAGTLAVAMAGLVYWHLSGAPGPGERILTGIGWIAWGLSAYAFAVAVRNFAISVSLSRRPDSPLPLAVGWANLPFAIVVGVSLWKTWSGEVSRLHLLWTTPLTLVVCLLLVIHRLIAAGRSA